MRTEREKMLAGELYDACDAELLKDLNEVKVRCQQYNNLLPTDFAARNKMLRDMLGLADEDTFINQPFYCDYGKHIRVGKRFFANFGLTILDEAYVTILPGVTIGDNCTIGAGSVVTHDIPANSIAAGNPARIIKIPLRGGGMQSS